MKRIFASVFGFLFFAVLLLNTASASAYSTGVINTTTPIDISWPQCETELGVNNRSFVVVGVNGGLATNTNPCLQEQLTWAKTSPGITGFKGIELYVNTANPGGLGTPSWPSNNVDPEGDTAPNPHGTCNNGDTLACAWQYGWNRAVEAAQQRFIPAAQAAGISTIPGDYRWWLDVETENTWKEGSTFAKQSNVADLEGMMTYFKSLPSTSGSVSVGLYSTNYQWNLIVGSQVTSGSNLRGRLSWLAGATGITTAGTLCKDSPLTSGGRVALVQILKDNIDYNVACPILKFSSSKVSNTRPKEQSYITYSAKVVDFSGQPLSGAKVTFKVYYKSSSKSYTAGTTSSSGTVSERFKVNNVSSSYKVRVVATANKNGATTTYTSYFTPRL